MAATMTQVENKITLSTVYLRRPGGKKKGIFTLNVEDYAAFVLF